MTIQEDLESYTFPVGKVVGFLGLKGELKIRPEPNNPTLLLDIEDVQIQLHKEIVMADVEKVRLEKRLIIIKFEGYPDRTSVEHFMDALVFTQKAQIPDLEEDEWWVNDLVGLSVYTTTGRLIGTICGITGGAGELLEVAKDGNESSTCLIPFVKALVPVVDIKGKRVEVVDLPGLFD